MEQTFQGYLSIEATTGTSISESINVEKQEITAELLKELGPKFEDLFSGKSTIAETDKVNISVGISTEGEEVTLNGSDVTLANAKKFIDFINSVFQPAPVAETASETNMTAEPVVEPATTDPLAEEVKIAE